MKKLLALVLALVMTLSLCTVTNAAFPDAADVDYKEAVDVMSAVGVFKGDEKGNFNPDANLTRDVAAKLIAYLDLGEKVAEALPAVKVFSDVEASNWAAKYIAYCADAGYIAGVGDGTFNPGGELTGYAFGKLLLCVLGYDANIEGFTGASWSIAVAKLMQSNDIAKGVDKAASAVLTREEAAQYCLNALKATCVEYDDKGTQISINGAVISTGASKAADIKSTKDKDYRGATKGDEVQQLCEKLYGTDLKITATSADKYDRPAHEWKYKKDAVSTYADTADFTFTSAVKAADMAAELAGYIYSGNKIKNSKTDAGAVALAGLTANGKVVELYLTDDEITKVVEISTFIEKVTAITKDKASTKDVDERAIKFGSYTVAYEDDVIDNFDEVYADLEVNDYVLYTLDTSSKIASVTIPETVEGVVSKANADEIVVAGTTYKYAENKSTVAVDKDAQTIWLDSYGYAMRGEKVAADASDVVYLVSTYDVTDKYGTPTYYAQIVTAEGEVEEIVIVAADDGSAAGAYTYTVNSDDEADLTAATATEAVAVAGEAVKTSDAKLKYDTDKYYYYADEVNFVYIDGKEAKLKVTTADGVQKIASLAAGSYAVLNSDKEITTVFVAAKADTTVNSDDLVFVKKTDSVGTALDLKNKEGNLYEFYKDGEKQTEIVKTAPTAIGYYTYSVDTATGVYTLNAETTDVKSGTLTATSIVKDKFLTIDGISDGVLAADCEVYDLTDNGADTLAAMNTLVKDGETLKVMAIYNSTDKEFTCIYVY